MKTIESPALDWLPDGTPRSSVFDDIYFAPQEGMAETGHVFLAGNGLPEAWRDRETFTIFETGFGTGLNFLCTLDAWMRQRTSEGQLHFVSVEGYPLTPEQLAKALTAYPDFETIGNLLIEKYPPLVPGNHRLQFEEAQVTLTLLFGPVKKMISDFDGCVDAWFLDGFAPSKNPQMWSPALFEAMGRCSRPGTTAATFTVAGVVRRGLASAGFDVERRPGFGNKRECLGARMRQRRAEPARAPWFPRPERVPRKSKVAVIGTGIAGATIAHRLHREGLHVTVFDRNDEIASEASGNPLGLINPRLSLSDDPLAHFREGACLFAVRYYSDLFKEEPDVWIQSGVIQIAASEERVNRQQRLVEVFGSRGPWFDVLTEDQVQERLGIEVDRPGLLIKQGGYLRPEMVCEKLLTGLDVRTNSAIDHLERSMEGWWLLGASQSAQGPYDCVVLANAAGANAFAQTNELPLLSNRGQITILPEALGTKLPCSFGGYLSPPVELRGQRVQILGATYGELEPSEYPPFSVEARDHENNLSALHKGLGIELKIDLEELDGRAAARTRTPDRVPLIGAVPVSESYKRTFGALRHGNPHTQFTQGESHDGLYVSAGFGSRGFQWAPMAAEIIASEMLGLPSPVSRAALEIVHPARFIVRQLRRA